MKANERWTKSSQRSQASAENSVATWWIQSCYLLPGKEACTVIQKYPQNNPVRQQKSDHFLIWPYPTVNHSTKFHQNPLIICCKPEDEKRMIQNITSFVASLWRR